MATYLELFSLRSNDALKNRIAVACVIAAGNIRTEAKETDNYADRLAWAARVFANPTAEAERMLWAVLAQNAHYKVEEIVNAPDATVQAAVNAAINVFAVGG